MSATSRRSTFQRALSILLCSVGGALATACSDPPAPGAPEIPEPTIRGEALSYPPKHPHLEQLRTVAAQPAKPIEVQLPAKLVWNEERTQRVHAPFSGRVVSIRTDVGSAVKRGSVLAELASPDFGMAQAEGSKARADLNLAQKTLQRQRELHEAGIIARKEFEVAEAEAARAMTDVRRTQARTQLYGGGSGIDQRLMLTSNIAGVVVERHINPGQELRSDAAADSPLFVVTDPTSLWVVIDATEAEAAVMRPGTPFVLTVASLPGALFEGKVTAASDSIDASTRTLKVRGVVSNPERRLKAGMLGVARLERSLGEGVLIPASAVTLRGNGHSVYVQTQPGVFTQRAVKLGYEGTGQVLVVAGLQPGESVVVENVLLLARQLNQARDTAAATRGASGAGSAPRAEAGK